MGKLYKALWVLQDEQGIIHEEFEHDITQAEYDFVPGQRLADRVDTPRYRRILPTPPQKGLHWRLHHAARGSDAVEELPDGSTKQMRLTSGQKNIARHERRNV